MFYKKKKKHVQDVSTKNLWHSLSSNEQISQLHFLTDEGQRFSEKHLL